MVGGFVSAYWGPGSIVRFGAFVRSGRLALWVWTHSCGRMVGGSAHLVDFGLRVHCVLGGLCVLGRGFGIGACARVRTLAGRCQRDLLWCPLVSAVAADGVECADEALGSRVLVS